MDLYTDCPECDGKGYYIRQMYNEAEPDRMQCATCHNTGKVHFRVKALEWDDALSATPFDGSTYDIYVTGPLVIDAEHSYEGDIGTFTTISAAKAACQAHHERMVMDMLEVV